MSHPAWLDGPHWTHVPASDDTPAYNMYTGPLSQPVTDKRAHRLLRLTNGIQVVLVHDPKTDKAAVSMHVAAGYMEDPDDMPGLAHLCGRMLMKGSCLDRNETAWSSYISGNGGTTNSITSAAWQDFYFTVKPDALGSALTRHAAYFHSPQFDADEVGREIHAIDAQFQRNTNADERRTVQVLKSLSAEGHPWRKFGTGNMQTLTEAARDADHANSDNEANADGKNGDIAPRAVLKVRRRLFEWWEKECCAGRMPLAVVGRESIEELTKLVVRAYSTIPNRNADPRPVYCHPVWNEEQMGTIVFVKTLRPMYTFRVSFMLPDQALLYQTCPATFVAQFLAHLGPGSISAYLKAKGWVVSLRAGYNPEVRSAVFLEITGELTREGYLHYEEVLLTIFNYISLLRTSLDTMEPYHHVEQAYLSALRFMYAPKLQPEVYARALARGLLAPLTPERLLDGGELVRTL